jgi:uncharacterized phage protein (TIGR02218 family)
VEGRWAEVQEREVVRSASAPLIAHLNALRAGDAKTLVADLYTFTLRSGTILTYTNADVPITWNGYTYLADSVLVEGLKFKCAAGLDVDQQQITIAARETDTVAGVPFFQALRSRVFDGCEIMRERAFLTAWNAAPAGAVLLFKGRIGTIDKIGRTEAEITVNSDLVLLDLEMPRNIYTANCQHVLYDSGCTLAKESFGANGTVDSGSTRSVIVWSGGAAIYSQGTVTFLTGANAGVRVNVKQGYASAGGGLNLSYPLPNLPAVGDTFRVYQGCDHTKATCLAKFDNLLNFRGFPYIPPPTTVF